jgi:glutamate--cysteine ligase
MTFRAATALEPISVHDAAGLIRDAALRPTPIGRVGLELEGRLVDFTAPGAGVGWDRLTALVPVIESAARCSVLSFEPGGQVELSGLPAGGIVAAIDTMRTDAQRVRLALAEHDAGLAWLGADPVRGPQRVNPRPRYRAMAEHFAAVGVGEAGATMMCSSAALQVNLEAGPQAGWADRVALAQQLGPTLSAMSACSRWLSGRDSGSASARELAWSQLRENLRPSADPVEEWVRYALAAPVMFCADERAVRPVTTRVAFADWARGRVRLADRLPTARDLDHHLSTLFPPVRLRGYLELRYFDASPPRWWPAIAAVATVLLDDPVAADAAREAVAPVGELWPEAARAGLRDARLATAARRCVEIAVVRGPVQLRAALEDLAELVASARCPGDLVAERIAEIGPLATFAELAHA